jgi:hypothetical protein
MITIAEAGPSPWALYNRVSQQTQSIRVQFISSMRGEPWLL